MATTKRCGYCREAGHDKRVCKVMAYKQDMIKKHILGERRNIMELLARNGYGDGAIVSAYSWRHGKDVNAMITNETLNMVSTFRVNLIDYRNIKYTKRVRVNLKSFTNILPEGYNEEISADMFTTSLPSIGIEAMNLEDPSENVPAYIFYHKLDIPSVARPLERGPVYMWERPATLLSPSTDLIVDESLLDKNVYIHERLE